MVTEARRAYNAAYYKAHAEEQRALKRQWRKDHPDEMRVRNRQQYEAQREERLVYAAKQREADPEYYRSYHKERYAANSKRFRDYARTRRQANPEVNAIGRSRRQARLRSNSMVRVRPRDLRDLLGQYGECCAYCRGPLDLVRGSRSPRALHWDHVIPLARGGAHSKDNLVPACRSCNESKHTRLVEEWRP